MRQAVSAILAVLLVSPPSQVLSAPSQGTIQGVVTMQGRPLQGVGVAFIELESGDVVRATSGANGGFETKAAPGQYAVTTESQAGLAIGKAPVRVSVVPGKLANAEIELVAVASAMLQEPRPSTRLPPPAPSTDLVPADALAQPPAEGQITYAQTTGAGATIQFEPVTCFVAGEFPLLDAAIEPLPNVARARTYFKAAQGESFYYVEMTQEAGRFYGKLPRPKVEASPITYYLQSTTTEFEESQTTEIEAIIVDAKEECGDRKIAVFGPPGEVTVFSAASGAAIAPIGFAAGGAAIAAGTVALIVAGAAAAGVVGGIVVPPQPTTIPTTITLAPITITPITLPTPIPITTFR
jgi:hypothetical protein